MGRRKKVELIVEWALKLNSCVVKVQNMGNPSTTCVEYIINNDFNALREYFNKFGNYIVLFMGVYVRTAVQFGRFEILRWLIVAKGATCTDSLIYLAATHGRMAIMIWLIKRQIPFEVPTLLKSAGTNVDMFAYIMEEFRLKWGTGSGLLTPGQSRDVPLIRWIIANNNHHLLPEIKTEFLRTVPMEIVQMFIEQNLDWPANLLKKVIKAKRLDLVLFFIKKARTNDVGVRMSPLTPTKSHYKCAKKLGFTAIMLLLKCHNKHLVC